MTAYEMYMRMLKNAHAMEKGMEDALEKQLEHADIDDHLGVRMRIQEHLEETRTHAGLIEAALHRHDESPSKARDWMAKLDAGMLNFNMGDAHEKLTRDILTGAAAERMEISMYNALLVAAEQADDATTVSTIQTILKDEEDMARFYEGSITDATRHMLAEAA